MRCMIIGESARTVKPGSSTETVVPSLFLCVAFGPLFVAGGTALKGKRSSSFCAFTRVLCYLISSLPIQDILPTPTHPLRLRSLDMNDLEHGYHEPIFARFVHI